MISCSRREASSHEASSNPRLNASAQNKPSYKQNHKHLLTTGTVPRLLNTQIARSEKIKQRDLEAVDHAIGARSEEKVVVNPEVVPGEFLGKRIRVHPSSSVG